MPRLLNQPNTRRQRHAWSTRRLLQAAGCSSLRDERGARVAVQPWGKRCIGTWSLALVVGVMPSLPLGVVGLSGLAPMAWAQSAEVDPASGDGLGGLDDGQFIDGLRRHGLSDLMVYYAREHAPKDGDAQAFVAIAGHRLVFDDVDQPLDRRAKALADAIAALDQLSQDQPESPSRPIWQTDMAEMLLLNDLTVVHRLALDAVSLGSPTQDQTDAYIQGVSRAALVTQQADERLYELQGMLPLRANYQERFVETGLADRLFETYGQGLLPFYEGLAAVHAAMLPADAPYWDQAANQLGESYPDVVDERQRLLELADVRLSSFDRQADAFTPGYGRTARVARAMAQWQMGQSDLAIDLANGVIEEDAGDLAEVRAVLVKAKALDAQSDRGAAMQTLVDYAGRLTREHPEWLHQRLLVADAHHALLMEQANTDADVLAAYQPYETLKATHASEQQAGVEQLLAERWTEQLEHQKAQGKPLKDLPVPVRLAVSRYASQVGYRRAQAAGANAATGEAAESLQQALDVLASINIEALPIDQQMAAQFDRAVAMVGLQPKDIQTRLDAVAPLIALASQHPGEPDAESLIADGTRWLLQLHQALGSQIAGAPKLDAAFREAMSSLLLHFPTSTVTDDTRLYFAASVLFNRDQAYTEAAEVLAAVPVVHPTYFDSQTLRLRSLWRAAKAARNAGEDATVGRLAMLLGSASETVHRQAQAKADARPKAEQAMAAAELAQAQSRFLQNDVTAASSALAGFANRFDQLTPDLVTEAMQTQLMVFAAAGETEKMVDAAEGMMAKDANQASGVVTGAVMDMEAQIDGLKVQAAQAVGIEAQRLNEQIRQQGVLAHGLASQLLANAKTRNLSPDDLLPYQLLNARTLWLSGQPQAAVEQMSALGQSFGNKLPVVFHLAEAQYQAGIATADPKLLQPAFQGFARIDSQLKNTAEPPSEWWHARLRQLQIVEALKVQNSRAIVRNILQLQTRDASFGGPLYAPAFEKLLAKHRTAN